MTRPEPAPVRCAMILAAGRGERMRPLSDATPKPLLPVAGKPLIVWHIEALARAGIDRIVINTAWQEARIVEALGDGSRWGVALRYSLEGERYGGALETAGGIATARPWEWPECMADDTSPAREGEGCYWLVSGDIFCPGFAFDAGLARCFMEGTDLAHLWLAPNPAFHAQGDFLIEQDGADGAVARARPARGWGGEQRGGPRIEAATGPALTYANLALCRAELTARVPPGTRAALGPLLFEAALAGHVGARLWTGRWENVGTPDQLHALDVEFSAATGQG